MEWYYWVIIIVLALIIIGQFVGAYYGFRYIIPMKPQSDSLLNRDLDNSKFQKHKEKIIENILFMQEKEYVDVYITSKDKLKLHGCYINNNSDTTVLFVHGYRSRGLNDFAWPMRKVYEKGYNILHIDQRCHGQSEGKYVTFGIKERIDVLNWVNYINNNYKPKNIVIYGMSMGCATSSMALPLMPSNVKCAILDCGFSGVYKLMVKQTKDMIKVDAHLPVLIMNIYCRLIAGFSMFKASPKKALSKINIPCFFIHGTEDSVIPLSHTIENYEACGSKVKDFAYIEGAEHGMSYYDDYPNLEQRVMKFIEEAIEM